MNMNLSLNLDAESLKKLLPLLWKAQPYIFGALLIGVFAYTAYEVNAAVNVKALPASAISQTGEAKIIFNQTTINSVKNLQPVGGDVPTGTLGSSNPFN
jgi:hypothetical protein